MLQPQLHPDVDTQTQNIQCDGDLTWFMRHLFEDGPASLSNFGANAASIRCLEENDIIVNENDISSLTDKGSAWAAGFSFTRVDRHGNALPRVVSGAMRVVHIWAARTIGQIADYSIADGEIYTLLSNSGAMVEWNRQQTMTFLLAEVDLDTYLKHYFSVDPTSMFRKDFE